MVKIRRLRRGRTEPLRVLVCGSRTFRDKDLSARVLGRLLDHGPLVLISGGARGADSHARVWAAQMGQEFHEFPADWDRYGRSAGYRRNRQMLEEGAPDLVVAFVDKPLPESRGTANMVDLARRAGVEVQVHRS